MTKIKQFRESRGHDQSSFAREANLYASLLCQLEKGRAKAGPKVRGRIATALNVDESELFDDKGWPIWAEAVV
jgi:transcriptional regulator with XRE-family HTH domain